MPKYTITNPQKFGKIKPEVAAAELARIHDENDGLRPAEVVEAARPKSAPLHPAFEWRDKVAGESWRRHQAANLCRSVRIIQEEGAQPEPLYAHVTVNAPDGADRSYQSMERILQRTDLFTIALSELHAKVNAALRAVHEVERAAAGGEDADRSARIAIAVKAADAFQSAVEALH